MVIYRIVLVFKLTRVHSCTLFLDVPWDEGSLASTVEWEVPVPDLLWDRLCISVLKHLDTLRC